MNADTFFGVQMDPSINQICSSLLIDRYILFLMILFVSSFLSVIFQNEPSAKRSTAKKADLDICKNGSDQVEDWVFYWAGEHAILNFAGLQLSRGAMQFSWFRCKRATQTRVRGSHMRQQRVADVQNTQTEVFEDRFNPQPRINACAINKKFPDD